MNEAQKNAIREADNYLKAAGLPTYSALTTSQPAQAGEVDERAAFEKAARQEGCGDFRRVGDAYSDRRTLRCYRIWQKARASLPTPPAAQATPPLIDSIGMPTSCGKPLCSPDDHHPLCRLHKPAAKAGPEPVADAQVCKHGEQVFYGSGPVMHKASGVIFDTIIAAADPSSLIPLTPMQPAQPTRVNHE